MKNNLHFYMKLSRILDTGYVSERNEKPFENLRLITAGELFRRSAMLKTVLNKLKSLFIKK